VMTAVVPKGRRRSPRRHSRPGTRTNCRPTSVLSRLARGGCRDNRRVRGRATSSAYRRLNSPSTSASVSPASPRRVRASPRPSSANGGLPGSRVAEFGLGHGRRSCSPVGRVISLLHRPCKRQALMTPVVVSRPGWPGLRRYARPAAGARPRRGFGVSRPDRGQSVFRPAHRTEVGCVSGGEHGAVMDDPGGRPGRRTRCFTGAHGTSTARSRSSTSSRGKSAQAWLRAAVTSVWFAQPLEFRSGSGSRGPRALTAAQERVPLRVGDRRGNASQRPSEPRDEVADARADGRPVLRRPGHRRRVWCIIPSGQRKFTEESSIDSTISLPSPRTLALIQGSQHALHDGQRGDLGPGKNVRTELRANRCRPCPATIDDHRLGLMGFVDAVGGAGGRRRRNRAPRR